MKQKRRLSGVILYVQLSLCVLGIAGCGTADREAMLFSQTQEVQPTASTEDMAQTLAESCTYIYVFVCGAVASPGVVELPEGSRAEAALNAAGGFTQTADRDYVNLAAHLEDGEKLFFPTVSEAEELRLTESAQESGLVDINSADATELCTLPGIGEVRAGAIIAYRDRNGAFSSIEELKRVDGITDSIYEKLADRIIVLK